MSGQSVHEFRVVEQPANLSADVAPQVAGRVRDLVDDSGTTVKDHYDVFEVAARIEVSVPSSAECLQFSSDKVRSGYDPQLKSVERDDGGSFNGRLEPAVREPKDGFVCRHD